MIFIFKAVVVGIVGKSLPAGGTEGDDTFLVTFAERLDIPVIQVDIPGFQGTTSERRSPVSNIKE